jgi:hypothetical protein
MIGMCLNRAIQPNILFDMPFSIQLQPQLMEKRDGLLERWIRLFRCHLIESNDAIYFLLNNMSSRITELGIALIVMYCIMKILDFYGIGLDEYVIFVAFYLFLAMCHFVLNKG